MGAVLAIVLAAAAVNGAPARPGACGMIHGEMYLSNGMPDTRIRVGKRILGVVQNDLTFDQLPPKILRVWGGKDGESFMGHTLRGDFRVCAVTRQRPGWMQMVRVVGGRNLVRR